MSDPRFELPSEQTGQRETLGPVTSTNRRLYLVVIIVLGLVLLIGVVGWIFLASTDRALPDGLGVILGTVAGGLVALVSDPSGTRG